MRRRNFISLVGGAASWPLAVRAQQRERMRRIGVLMALAESDREGQALVAAFREGLQKLGWAEGRNIRIDYRWTALDKELMQRFAKELVALQPDLILTHRKAPPPLRCCCNKRAPFPSFSGSLPIRSAAASLQVFRGPEETSLA